MSYCLLLGSPVRSRDLDLVIFMSLFQLKIFYDSKTISCFYPQIHVPLCNAMQIWWLLFSIKRSFHLQVHISVLLAKGKNGAEQIQVIIFNINNLTMFQMYN